MIFDAQNTRTYADSISGSRFQFDEHTIAASTDLQDLSNGTVYADIIRSRRIGPGGYQRCTSHLRLSSKLSNQATNLFNHLSMKPPLMRRFQALLLKSMRTEFLGSSSRRLLDGARSIAIVYLAHVQRNDG